MNASYKIVLLAAFVIFAAVVGYYIIKPGGDPANGQDGQTQGDQPLAERPTAPAAQPPAQPDGNAPSRSEPPGRAGLDRTPPVTPQDPGPGNQVTIGTPDNTDDQVRLGPGVGDSLTDATGAEDRVLVVEPGDNDTPGTTDNSGTTDTTGPGEPTGTDQGTDTPAIEPDNTDRPGPFSGQPSTADNDEQTTTPPTREETPTPTPPTSRPRNTRSYTVQAGDTFASIAIAEYGEEAAWFEIAQANPTVDPKRLQVGQVIVLPARDAIERERGEPQPPAPGQDQTYTVRPNDNLSRIAIRFYNDSEKWDLIYNRNRDKIGPNPDRLQAGMVLVIPQAYSGAE